ncbi:VOC family protein [Longispora sp. K20-0274]|uniref:VOC family protein n=1 Tax=Longispora sp. K20-0274 TaxID=3088255 RepID=UPI00399AAE26
MIEIETIDHVVLRVTDEPATERFYRDVLGCTVESRRDDIGLLQLRAGAALIDLVRVDGKLGSRGGRAPGAEGRNMDHLCLRVAGYDEEAILAHLRAHGVEIGELGSRRGAQGVGPSVYIRDPEGNTVELKGPPDEA